MTNIDKAHREGFKIEQLAKQTWAVIDRHDASWGHYDTERKANNAMNKIGGCYQ